MALLLKLLLRLLATICLVFPDLKRLRDTKDLSEKMQWMDGLMARSSTQGGTILSSTWYRTQIREQG